MEITVDFFWNRVDEAFEHFKKFLVNNNKSRQLFCVEMGIRPCEVLNFCERMRQVRARNKFPKYDDIIYFAPFFERGLIVKMRNELPTNGCGYFI
jgi:hypothetical protein